MHPEDAVDIARSIKQLQFGEWTDVVDGLVYMSCGDCGMAHAVLLKQTGPRMYRIRIDHEATLCDATRENDKLELPIYRELLTRREQVKQLEARVAELEQTSSGIPLGEFKGAPIVGRVIGMKHPEE